MDDLKCGDVCICDLSLSMNTHKHSVVPLVFISVSREEETPIYAFCRIGKAPEAYSRYPFVEVAPSECLRRDSAVYPTQTVLFSGDTGILSTTGCLAQDEIRKVMELRKQNDKENAVALVMTLCPRCRRDFMTDPASVVIRMDPFAVQETQCDYCQIRNGHTYIIYKRKLYGRNKAR